MTQQILFVWSVFLATVHISYAIYRSKLPKQDILFAFVPLLFLYLGFLFTSLSVFHAVTSIGVLIWQHILSMCVLLDLWKNPLKVTLPATHTAFKTSAMLFKKSFDHSYVWLTTYLITILLLSSFGIRLTTPVSNRDDKMYRISAPLYWTQEKSIFRFPTLNERKNTFLMGSGLITLWPGVFHTSERTIQMFYWIGFPILTLLLLAFCLQFTKSSSVIATILLSFISAPLIFTYFTDSHVQELWLSAILLSYAHYLFSFAQSDNPPKRLSILLGISFILLPFLKLSALYYVISLFGVVILYHRQTRHIFWILAGALFGFILSGFFILSIQNTIIYGSPLGSKDFQQSHRAALSLEEAHTNIARFTSTLLEIPLISTVLSRGYTERIEPLVQFIGAKRVLTDEKTQLWIGVYNFDVPVPNRYFSLGGVFWLFVICASVIYAAKHISPNAPFSKRNMVVLLFIVSIIIEIIDVRWADRSGVPYRHLLAAYALMLGCVTIYTNYYGTAVVRFIASLCILLSILSATQLLFFNINELDKWWMTPEKIAPAQMDQTIWPYPKDILKPGNTYLLVETQDTIDYPLYSNNNHVEYIHSAPNVSASEYAHRIIRRAKEIHATYIVLFNQENDLIAQLEKTDVRKISITHQRGILIAVYQPRYKID